MRSIEVKPLTGTIGAEIRGLDISQPISSVAVDFIRAQLLEFHVIFFPKQRLTTDEHIAFGKCFGDVEDHYPSITARDDARPQITYFDGSKSNGRARIWHTDATVSATPPMGGILLMRETPARGGDTMWADLTAAYDSLSPLMKDTLGGMTAVHDLRPERHGLKLDYSNVSCAEHPLVRVHPETHRKCLFINPFFTSHIVGLAAGESQAILQYLFSVIQRPEFVCRWRWSTGDIAFWDNRCTMHVAVDDYGILPRLAERVCIKGDRPFGSAVPRGF